MIPVHQPVLDGNEKKYVMNCMNTGWISSQGGYIGKFEKKFAEFCNVKHAIATTSGTSALHLCTAALNLGKGDEVIMPSFTMIAPALAIAYTGAKPVFVDAEPKSWTIDSSKIKDKITKKTKAIMPVHIYGHPCYMDKIMEIAKKYNLYVIEDAAEAHGALYKGKKAGSFGHVNAFSCYSNKIVTTGEGGIVVTDDDKIAERVRSLKDFCFDKERRYFHSSMGFKYPMTNIQAAIGLAQLEKIERTIEEKRKMAATYNKYLKNIKGITTPFEDKIVKNVYWMYGILVDGEFGIPRDAVKKELYAMGVDTRFFFIGMHKQPPFKTSEKFPVTDYLSEHGFYLPSSTNLTEKQIRHICGCLAKIKEKHS